MSDAISIPIFPLHTVLFPDGPLPLRVFEPRYLDMISRCMKFNTCFGICLIREGVEVGKAASTFEMGTTAVIHDWHMRHDGLLGVTVRGERRFRILKDEVQANQLLTANIEYADEEAPCDVPPNYLPLVDVLRDLISQIGYRYTDLPMRFGDAGWVGYRLAELLPLRLAQKQYFLQLNDPLQRLERIGAVLETMNVQL